MLFFHKKKEIKFCVILKFNNFELNKKVKLTNIKVNFIRISIT